MRARELRDAATANFIAHATRAARRIRGALVASTPSLTMVDSGLDTETFNLVCGARLRATEVASNADRVLGHFREAGRPLSWWIAPGDAPHDLARRLTDAGLEEQETELAMSLRILDATARMPAPHGIEIQDVGSAAGIATFARINAENWDPPDPVVETFYRLATPALLAVDSPH